MWRLKHLPLRVSWQLCITEVLEYFQGRKESPLRTKNNHDMLYFLTK